MKFLTIGFLALSLSLNALAVETKICVITSDIDSEVTDMFIETNSRGDLDSVRLYKTMGTEVVSDETHPVERVIEEGIVAARREGRDVVKMKAPGYDFAKGGIIGVDYLFNGIKGTRKIYNLKLTRVGSSYALTTVEGAKVNRIMFVGNRAPLIGKLIGIREVKASFK